MPSRIRTLVFSGTADLESLLLEMFPALSGGRQLPKEPSWGIDERMYFGNIRAYRTSNGDGVFVPDVDGEVCLLTIGDDLRIDAWQPDASKAVFEIRIVAPSVDASTEVVIRMATAAGLTLVEQRDET